MPIFRVNKVNNFTIVANSLIYNPRLTFKAKNILIAMLGRPDDWDFTAIGLTKYARDGIASVNSGLKELEREGYLVRIQTRTKNGRFQDVVYQVYESPVPPEQRTSISGKPLADLPITENPITEKPETENQMLYNTIKPITEKNNTVSLITPSIPQETKQEEPWADGQDGRIDLDSARQYIREQIDYDLFDAPYSRQKLDELVELMLEVAIHREPVYSLSFKNRKPTSLVQDRFRKLNKEHIEMVLDSLRANTTKVRNPKAYLLTALFNAPATIDNHYSMMVQHDLCGGDST